MAQDLAEFTSKVKKQGMMLCFPLGKTLDLALRHFGFAPDQPVLLRFSAERLEIRPLNAPAVVREKLKRSAGELKSFTDRMRDYARDLPPGNQDDEESTEGDLRSLVECLIADNLDPAIRQLESVDELGGPDRSERGPGDF